ncbi:hypothetical protein BDV25DRAFT_140323 [Aspergillus avenaceus]|uniref:Alcohol acetyltransferase n=1 Tax=Aspergillus avenaceus TaxID=36643 RepID=A0A5N6TV00_ASPAV|nr:hypothetical protein BDV25DRAFT_140323 [Aspergillus avenaceus]
MAQSSTFMRFASPNERRTISREDLGFYNAVVIGSVYELAGDVDIYTAETFISALKDCVLEHPSLGVVVKDKHTEKPFYEAVSSIELHQHISIVHEEIGSEGEAKVFERVLPPILDRPFPADIPPWRIVVLPLPSNTSTVTRCFVCFAFSHSLGDGMVGLAFHRTFLEKWRQSTSTKSESSTVTLPSRTLPEPFDTPTRLPISWGFLLGPLLAVYLPKFLCGMLGLHATAGTINDGTWTGSPMFFNPASTSNSRVKILEIEAPLVQNAIQVVRTHDAKLTATIHQMIIRALSKAIPNNDVTNFVAGTAVDMRGAIGKPAYTWGLFVAGHYEGHERLKDAQQPISDELWTAAGVMTKALAGCATRLHDQSIGLLRYVPSIRKWTLDKLGCNRDSSYEVSNLLAFDGGAEPECRISKMVFCQPGNVTSAPMAFNILSVKGGSLMCTVSWQIGALGVPLDEEVEFVDGICSSIQADFKALSV